MLLGIDTGGTFTDFVFFDGHSVRTHKVLSVPEAPEQAILQGIREMQINLQDVHIVHGSTVATNAVLEGRGSRTVYITNRGLGDVLTIGRQARQELYNLTPHPVAPPVAREFCLEVGARCDANGNEIEPISSEDMELLRLGIEKSGAEAVAINLLYSWLNDNQEKRIAASLDDDLFISCSSRLIPMQGEYERGITTWLNAYTGPLMRGYLQRLCKVLKPARVSMMRSSGQTCHAEIAGDESVHLLLSGPAGGLNGARFIGNTCQAEKLLTFDMGGTSTDVALIDGDVSLTNRGRIAGYPVIVPMIDMHTIGAGGGSIAWVDAGGALQVGPRSAGANPGPACYGQGGSLPTITDANLVLGHIPEGVKLAGTLGLDRARALQAMEPLREQLGFAQAELVAKGIVRIANENMIQALRVVSVQRGVDPRPCTLMAFGGAGGLHVCALSNALGIQRAIIPAEAGVLSALGMIVTAPGRELIRTIGRLISEYTQTELEQVFAELIATATEALADETGRVDTLTFKRSLNLCYQGQGHSLSLAWDGNSSTVVAAFHELHEQQYGHRLDMPVELVNVCLSVSAQAPRINLQQQTTGTHQERLEYTHIYTLDTEVPVYARSSLTSNSEYTGPMVIVDNASTVYVEPDWSCKIDGFRNLLLKKQQSGMDFSRKYGLA